ncbi:Pycsar system effector family protein [Macrococcoides bohemicum]|uniref:Pycsar system effector family protein n=1 Tax=Macrococcoides bohemicum TaxID=1903056 RepID=UPI00165E6F2C|nr:Pycsar system effector family protein [Macrococcus bohemicus]MBC9873471.1 hypothetical protein [Macrococcus bohemicus]
MDIENYEVNLQRQLDWIKNTDTKSSIILSLYGVLITLLITNKLIDKFAIIISKMIIDISFSNIIYLVLMIFSFILILLGLYNLISVLIPRLSHHLKDEKYISKNSIIFFESINNYSYEEFVSRNVSITKDEYISDLVSQIYINSKICTKKHQLFTKGVKMLSIGSILFIFLYISGLIID